MSYFNKQSNWKFFIDDIESLSSGNILKIHNDITLTGNLNINGSNHGIILQDGTSINNNSSINTGSGGGSGSGSGVTPQEIDDRISNHLFNKPEAPTDSSHNFQIITSNNRTYPTITLQWRNPTTKRVAFPLGTTPGYNTPVTGNFITDFNSIKNITHLPHSKELKIEFHEENTPYSWNNLTLHNDGTGTTQQIIPNTVNTANLNTSNIAPTLIANTVTNTYTEFKSGKGLTIGKSYRFRIYLTNEITEENGSYNYLYIPSETEYIAFGGFANVTAPTEILFPVHDFYNLQIKGINSNAYAETGMNTTFPIPDNYDLRVRYGFYIDISANVNSKQMPYARGNIISGKFITGNLTGNTFTANINIGSSLQLENSVPINWYPEFDYNVSNFFMEANLDIVGNIAHTTIVNTIKKLSPTILDVNAATKFFDNLSTKDYTSFFSSNYFDMTKSNIYRYDDNTSIDNIYILDSTDSFDLTFNPNITVINNSNDYIGIDSSGVELLYFHSSILILQISEQLIRYQSNTNDTIGFLQVNDISVNDIYITNQGTTQKIEDSSFGMIINGSVSEASIFHATQGYYTDITLNELGVKNINLTDYPDICNNSYTKYRTNITQNIRYKHHIIPDNYVEKGPIYFDFGVAEKSASDITGLHNLVSP